MSAVEDGVTAGLGAREAGFAAGDEGTRDTTIVAEAAGAEAAGADAAGAEAVGAGGAGDGGAGDGAAGAAAGACGLGSPK